MRWSHGWGLVGQILAIWISVSFMVSPFIGKYLHARRAQREFKARIAREDAARLLRLSRRMRTADWVSSLPEHDKQRIQEKPRLLAFSILKTLPNSHPEMSLIGNQIDYQLEVNSLVRGSPYRAERMKDNVGLLTKPELERMEEARLFGTPAYVFAARLLEADSRDLAIHLRTKVLFETDPTCGICKERIARLEDAHLQTLATGEAYLIHPKCFGASIQQMTKRYFGRPRQARSA